MARVKAKHRCFGFYNGSSTCETCMASRRCRAIMASDGGDIMQAVLDELTYTDDLGDFVVADRPTEMVQQLLHPETRKESLIRQKVWNDIFDDLEEDKSEPTNTDAPFPDEPFVSAGKRAALSKVEDVLDEFEM